MATEPVQEEKPNPADGDYVAYGFGHPAHKPDPNAKYGFAADEHRPLPVKPDQRWRVTG